MAVFAKCMALSQEDTPEARRAVLDELAGLKIGDINVVEAAKKYIEELIKSHQAEMEDMLNKIQAIIDANKQIAPETPSEPETPESSEPEEIPQGDDGTQI